MKLLTSSLTFDVPPEDAWEFTGLPTITCNQVQWLLQVMKSIAGSKHKTKACHEIADRADCHFNTIYPKWKKYRDSGGDWRVLIDRRHTSEFWKRDISKQIGLPHDFIEFWKKLCEENQRCFKSSYRTLIRRWRLWSAGDADSDIPGYSRPPLAAAGSEVPLGWTYSNMLSYKPSDIELALVRQGREAALALMPGVTTTRIGTHPFGEIQFDDMWHDFEVNAPRQKQSCRLLEFNCADHHTNYIFRPGLKPRLKNQDDGKRKHLDSRDFHIFLVNWLLDYGVHPDGTVFNVENGTASITTAFEEKLLFWFRGKLTVIRSGMSGTPAFPGAYRERAKGNFRVKAIKEGAGKLIHNQLAGLIGQVGMRRDNLPAGHEGRSNENEALLFLQAAIPSLAGKLKLGFLDLHEAVYAVNDAYTLLNDRTDHNIEGWEECGYVVDEFRASPEIGGWLALDDVMTRCSDGQKQMLQLQMQLDPTIRRRRNLSPAEVMRIWQPRLIRLPDAAVPDLLGAAYGEVKEVREGTLTLTRPELPGKLRYPAIYQDDGGFRRRIDNGTEVLTHLNPWKPEWLYLSDAKTQRYLGRAELDRSITRGDVDAIHQRHGKAARDLKEAALAASARHGAGRIPHMRANTAALREAARPSARDQALAGADFDSSTMLDDDASDDSNYITADMSSCFDAADLLDSADLL